MSGWRSLRSKLIWPKEFVYIIENEGSENKFGYSYIVKYDGNIVKKSLKRHLNQINNNLKATNEICEDIEIEDNQHDSDDIDFVRDEALAKFNEANQIMLRLNDKKEFIENELSKINTIPRKFDIVIKKKPDYLFRLDLPFLNVENEYLIEYLKREYFKESTKKKKKKKKKDNKNNEEEEYRTYLYNVKIIESEITIIENREFIYSENNIEDLKIMELINEAKNIKNTLYEYKLNYESVFSDQEEKEEKNENESEKEKEKEKEKKREEERKREWKREREREGKEGENNKEKEITYENISVLPYSDIIKLKKKIFNIEISIAGFLTPFMLNGNIKRIIENIHQYSKYEFDNKIIYKSLLNIVQLMSYLESNNIMHGNIKPTNLFISNDGFHILIGNFIPKIKLWNNYFYVIQKKRKISKYISPELLFYLKKKIANVKKKKIKNIEKYFIKNDVFCLGLCFYYILTMKEDILNYIDAKQMFQFKVESVQKYITIPDLFYIIKNMLIYDHRQRPSWTTLVELIKHKEKEHDEFN